jgi:hypothetical protein
MSNLIDHAKREFLALGYEPVEDAKDDPNKWIQENILELLKVFSEQGHSGSSAPCSAAARATRRLRSRAESANPCGRGSTTAPSAL